MDILNTFSLDSNKQIKINFNGDDLSSDAGALLLKEFICKAGFRKVVKKVFNTNDTAQKRTHCDDDNLWEGEGFNFHYQNHGYHPSV